MRLERLGVAGPEGIGVIDRRRASVGAAVARDVVERAAGGVVGATAGGVVGWLAGVGALAIPGIGPFLAAGPLMAALAGIGIGGATGGLIGALVGMGIPEFEAKRYEGKLREGNILISVHTEDAKERDRAKDVFTVVGADDIAYTSEASVPKDTSVASTVRHT